MSLKLPIAVNGNFNKQTEYTSEQNKRIRFLLNALYSLMCQIQMSFLSVFVNVLVSVVIEHIMIDDG